MLSIIPVPPKNELLKRHIKYYFFIKTDAKNFNLKFTHYPHYVTTINAYLDSEILITDKLRTVNYQANNAVSTVFTNNRSFANNAHIKGKINAIGITFQPVGINHFSEKCHFKGIEGSVGFLKNYWGNHSDTMRFLLNSGCNNEKVETLDQLFLEKYHPIKDNHITEIVNHILYTNGVAKVQELEKLFSINRRTLLRLFKKYLGCSVSDFKQIVKFRSTLDSFQSNTNTSLTELAYLNDYYDQADFIKKFKKLTGRRPKYELAQIQPMNGTSFCWKVN